MAHVNGVGEVTSAQALSYYRRSGYKIAGEGAASTETTPEPESAEEKPKPRKRTPKT